jgi:hypothetical protein
VNLLIALGTALPLLMLSCCSRTQTATQTPEPNTTVRQQGSISRQTPISPQTQAAQSMPAAPATAGGAGAPPRGSSSGGSTFEFHSSPKGKTIATRGTIAPGSTFSSGPDGMLHTDRMRLSEGEMILMDAQHGGGLKIHAGMTMAELQRAARAQGTRITKVGANAYQVHNATLHFEGGRLTEIENPFPF